MKVFLLSLALVGLSQAAQQLLTLLPAATNLNLVVPALSLELALDSLLAWAVANHTAAALLPWLLLNILAALGLTSHQFSPHIHSFTDTARLSLRVETNRPGCR